MAHLMAAAVLVDDLAGRKPAQGWRKNCPETATLWTLKNGPLVPGVFAYERAHGRQRRAGGD